MRPSTFAIALASAGLLLAVAVLPATVTAVPPPAACADAYNLKASYNDPGCGDNEVCAGFETSPVCLPLPLP